MSPPTHSCQLDIFEKRRACHLDKLCYSLIKDVLTKSASEVFGILHVCPTETLLCGMGGE